MNAADFLFLFLFVSISKDEQIKNTQTKTELTEKTVPKLIILWFGFVYILKTGLIHVNSS